MAAPARATAGDRRSAKLRSAPASQLWACRYVRHVSTVFEQLRDEQFISLTTFRRSAEPVSTPVWVAPDGSALVVTTQLGTGKIKRLRHTLGYALTTKYGLVFRLILLAEGAFRRRAARRIVVRITEPTPPQ
jgi:hypothetical protein